MVLYSYIRDFLMNFPEANKKDPDGTPRSAASRLGLFCLHISSKKTSGLYVSCAHNSEKKHEFKQE